MSPDQNPFRRLSHMGTGRTVLCGLGWSMASKQRAETSRPSSRWRKINRRGPRDPAAAAAAAAASEVKREGEELEGGIAA